MHQIYRIVLLSITLLCFCPLSAATDVLSFPPVERVEKRMVLRLELSPQDEFLVTILSDRTLRLFDLRGENPRQILEVAGTPYTPREDERFEHAFSKDGMRFAVSYKDKIDIYQLKPKFTHETSIKEQWGAMITAMSFTHDAQSVVFATSYKMLRIVDIATQKNLFQHRLSSKIHGIASLKENSIATISQESPMIWRLSDDYSTLLCNHLLEFYNLPSRKITSSADGETIYIEDDGPGFLSYDSTSATVIGKGVSEEVQDSGMTISGDGALAALSVLDEINIYNARKKSERIKTITSPNLSFRIAFSQKNNNKIYIGSADGKVSILNID